LFLSKRGSLVQLQSGYSEADSVLGTLEQRPVKIVNIPLEALPTNHTWVTLLDVVPSKLLYAVISTTGYIALLQLSVTITNTYTVSVIKTIELKTYVKKAVSLCFEERRYFLLQGRHGELEFYGCDTFTYEVGSIEVEQEEQLLDMMLKDYNTENNIIGFKHNVCYYEGISMGRVPSTHKLLAVFGTTCDAYQMLVLNSCAELEWWRWTGTECEAVVIPSVPKVLGNLLWV
jgi:hypothetical protein